MGIWPTVKVIKINFEIEGAVFTLYNWERKVKYVLRKLIFF